MADNYIEKLQELYEARKAAWKQAQKYGKKKSTTVHRSNRLRVLQWPQNQRPPPKRYL